MMMMMMAYTSDWAVTSTLLFLDWSFSSRWGSFASSLNRWEWEWWQGLCCDNDDDDGDDDCHDDGGEGLEMMVCSSSSRGCGKAEGWDCSATGVQEREREWNGWMRMMMMVMMVMMILSSYVKHWWRYCWSSLWWCPWPWASKREWMMSLVESGAPSY